MKHRPFRWFATIALLLAAGAARAEPAAGADVPATSAAAASAPTSVCPLLPAVPDAAQRAELAGRAVDRGFLWRIDKAGRSSYLYGTVHVGRPDWAMPGKVVTQALRSTEQIALEMNPLDDDISSRLGSALAPRVTDPPLPPDLLARLAAQARAACLPDGAVAQFSPDVLAMTLVVVAGRRDGLEPAFGVDLLLAAMGQAMHHPVRSLETPEQQVAIIRTGDPAETRASIAQSLDELESGRAREQLLRIADVWAGGRFDELSRYAEWCGCMDTEAERSLMRRALDDRNPGLADGIAALHDGGHSVFAAVGSLHMIGPHGLPALLRARGFQVDRIEFRPAAGAQ